MKEFIDKLIERLVKERDEYQETEHRFEEDYGGRVALDLAISIVKQLAEEYKLFGNSEQVNVSEMPTGWIPCSERLPEKGGSYIVYSKTGSVYLSHYYKNSIVPHWSKNSGNIKAWMPLPAPYTEGE